MEGDGSDNENDFFNPEEEVEITPSSKVNFFHFYLNEV